MKSYRNELEALAEKDFAAFQSSIVTTLLEILGVRVPKIRALAKECYRKEGEASLGFVYEPIETLEESMLQGFLIEQVKDPERCYMLLTDFLPTIDNWAVCDTVHPKAILKDRDALRDHAKTWCQDPHEFVRRFGIVTFLRDLTGEAFDPSDPEIIAGIADLRYYVLMAQAWYFQKALAAQPETVWPYFEEHRLHLNLEMFAIRKCIESRVFSKEEKDRLRRIRADRKNRCSQSPWE